jgi:hypothetical protein
VRPKKWIVTLVLPIAIVVLALVLFGLWAQRSLRPEQKQPQFEVTPREEIPNPDAVR